MEKLLDLSGSIVGAAGVAICAVSGLTRVVSGAYYLAGLEATTLFLAGIGMMVCGCLLKLEALAIRARRD